MSRVTIFILGGYGNAGFQIARFLLKETDVQLILAGRNPEKAREAADRLNNTLHARRVESCAVDAADPGQLMDALKPAAMVILAASTVHLTRIIAETALKLGIDYYDILLSSPQKLEILNSLSEQIQSAGCCFITDGGFHPGVPAAMVRYASTNMDAIESANIYAAFQLDWSKRSYSKTTIAEFVEELRNFKPQVFRAGGWSTLKMSQFPKIDFDGIIGKRTCTPMLLEEIFQLTEVLPTLKEAGFYISGFNTVTDYLVMPLVFVGLKLLPQTYETRLAQLFFWSLKRFSKPPYFAVLQLSARGIRHGESTTCHMRLYHPDAYVLTAIPVTAFMLQYLARHIRKPGLWLQAHLVNPQPFFKDIKRMGISLTVT